MIKTFKSKALRKLFENEDARGLPRDQVSRIESRLAVIDSATSIDDFSFDRLGFHPMKGDLKGFYALKVTGNYRIIFRFEDGNAYDVDYLDYH